jgi:hypothetical protein
MFDLLFWMGLNRPFINRKEGRRVMERDNSVLRRPIGHKSEEVMEWGPEDGKKLDVRNGEINCAL